MGKQFRKVKKTLAILLAVLFVVSLTAITASASPPGGFGKGDGSHNWDRGGWKDRDYRGGHDWGHGGWKGCGWWNNWCRWDRWGHGW